MTDWTSIYAKCADIVKEDDTEEQSQTEEVKSKREAPKDFNQLFAACNHDHSDERRVYEMPTQDKLDAMKRFSMLGNLFADEAQYQRALNQYKRILVYFEYCFPDTDAEENAVSDMRFLALLGSTRCSIMLTSYAEAVSSATQALSIRERDCEVLELRARAYRMLGKFSEATQDLKIAFAQPPSTPSVRKEISLLRSEILSSRAAAKQAFGGTLT